MSFRDLPINRKLMRVIMLITLSALLLNGVAAVAFEWIVYRKELVERAETFAELLAESCAAPLIFHDPETAQQYLSVLRPETYIQQAVVYDTNGAVFASFPTNAPVPVLKSQARQISRRTTRGELELFHPILYGREPQGTLYLRSTLLPLMQRLEVFGPLILGVILLSSVLAFVLTRLLARSISEPILSLAGAAKKVSDEKDYAVRAQQLGQDEIGVLTAAFNHMLQQIQERDDALRRQEEHLRLLNADLENRVRVRTAELLEANQELEAFSYSVAHDLRAPLRHIDAYAQMLQAAGGISSGDAATYLERIRSSVHVLGHLVDALLNLARLGRSELNVHLTDLNVVIQDVINDSTGETANRNIEWRIAPLPQFQCDPDLMRQVFANLISNALKFTRPRDRAVIEIGYAPVDGQQAIYVRDNGVGFDMSFANKLFGLFQRLHRVDEFEGTGIGLATVERIVRKHGGRIWAYSEPDKGATFYFTLGTALKMAA